MKNFLNANPCRILCSLSLGLVVLLSACGEKPGAAAPKASTVDQLAPRYESTLAEGIDFKKPGYPNFLIEVAGVSDLEEWGRWTDAVAAPQIKVRFDKPLPKKFVLELQANAFGPNEGKPTRIRAGNIERVVTIKNVPSYAVYTAEFDDVVSTDTIEIFPPNPVLPREVDPASKDERKLGLGLVSLKIKTTN
jgi:phosphoglycerol transferase